ncbi:MAG: MMPL family transporter [Actinobacteria bacterium]|nr:MAG: MMPL family transporter [Actinomycetota bacterium]
MASVLYRLGGWAFDRRRTVVAIWIAVLLAFGALAAGLGGPESDTFTVPGTESQRALDLLKKEFPGTGGAVARIVFAAPRGHKLNEPRYRTLIAPTLKLAQQVPQSVGGAKAFGQSAQLSKAGRILFADLHFVVPVAKLKQSTRDALARVAGPARRGGLQVEFSGGVLTTSGSGEGGGDVVGLIVAFLVLWVVFGRALPAGLPLLKAIIGVALGLLGITFVAGLIEVSSTTPTLAVMLGLAVGIDYSLFILSRHRQHLAEGLDPRESAARAVATAGGSVLFAGTTVVIALVGLVVVGIPFLSVMGVASAATIAIAVLIALTLGPAVFGFAGPRLHRGKNIPPDRSAGRRWGQFVARRRWPAALVVIVIAVVAALPAAHMRLGLPDDGTKPTNSTQRRAYDLLTKGFGPGYNGPLELVVVDNAPERNLPALIKRIDAAIPRLPDVADVSPPLINQRGNVAIFEVTPLTSPQSQATKNLVKLLRGRAKPLAQLGVQALVTGTTAINIDTSDKLAGALPTFLPLIVGLALILLLLVFRSILVPVKAVVGFLLTIAASFGAVVWIFQDGHLNGVLGIPATAPVTSFLPIIMIAILFGLAMDYEVFLVSRMRESYLRSGRPTEAVIGGFSVSARVVTAAAIIMTSVFASFVTGDDLIIKSFGVALAFGVLIDAFLVRMTLVPAILALVGNSAWHLPGWLARRVPDLDVEGEQLIERLEAQAASPPAATPRPERSAEAPPTPE